MQDTIILGNGTSKQIKTASLPNSYAEFKAMAENGNLFADIKLNADGCEVVGTPLNKLNLLTDETADKMPSVDNVDKAINFLNNNVNGIPVDLTGIYNTQVIGYDETTGTLVPMMNVARTEIVIPNTITPVPWVAILGELNENTTQPSFTLSDELPKAIVRFTMPYTLSEFTTMKIGIYHYNTKDVLHKVRFSKTYDFSVVEAEYSVQGWSSSSDTVTCDITNLTGTYYMEVEFNRYQDNTRAVLTSLSFST